MAHFWASSRRSCGPRQRAGTLATKWLCWQSLANPSLPAISQYAGRISQIAGEVPTYSCRKPQHLRALDSTLPNLTSRENLFHSKEASRADEVFGTHRITSSEP